jgi:cyclophilin family peptidyl-prolyl cis-trans isomerase
MKLAHALLFSVVLTAPVFAEDVVLETSLGNIKLKLDAEKAPITVKNFLRYVKGGQYDGTIFHRVIPGFMAQGGGFDEKMNERAHGAPIKNEHSNGLTNRRGTVAMARTNDPDSATAQFFINVKDNSFLDRGPGYAVFGDVVEGMEVVDKIVAQPTTTKGMYENVPKVAIVIKKARLLGAAPAAPARPAKPEAKPEAGAESGS